MSLYRSRVLVRLRPSVLDPAGEATRAAANKLGIDGISRLRIGKVIEIEIEASNETEAKSKLEVISDRLLANPVIEDWSLEMAVETPLQK
ncbi:phosphoribosylformylglycinamidine synthase subunit PurS [Prochlorococcus sp. MIT 1223]|uniref:phosphoribosylformylglycinamidine synthase subunit PurS n=1 Tax=Prochlorococcus sp. MIT 1223 TaxID=3096217 RepID=UPI002A74E736|nr:phosphoribosylformylglycinamidine synthase subunit PurS [Prochlorococcus sp. MIT 1223]|tara:strand:- start:116 stop:385 length:270 start_codon:yes stop_codon:yes gene_type:complete